MEAGIVQNDGLTQLLRSTAQRRRQGILEITLPDGKISVSFVAGRITEVTKNDLNPIVETWGILCNAGYVQGILEVGTESSYRSILEQAPTCRPELGPELEDTILKRAIVARVCNHLYSLEDTPTGLYSFQSQMVENDKDFSCSISVGQLLLDLVQLASDADRFNDLFPAEYQISTKRGEMSANLSNEEGIVLDLIEGGSNLFNLREKAILSEYKLREALFRLHERGLLIVKPPPKKAADVLGADVLSQLELSIDSAFSDSLSKPQQDNTAPESQLIAAGEKRVRISLSARLSSINTNLLTSEIVPIFILVVYLLAAWVIPFFNWGRGLNLFSHTT